MAESKDALEQIAVTLGTDIGINSIGSASSVDKFHQDETNSKLNKAQYTQVVLEFMYLFLHLVDRISFGIVKSEENRAQFLDLLFHQIVKWFQTGKTLESKFPPDASAKLKKFELELPLEEKIKVSSHYKTIWQPDKQIPENVLMDSFLPEEMNERNLEYAKYELVPNEDGSWDNTVYRKFAEHISEVVTGKTGFAEDTFPYIMNIIIIAHNSSASLNIRGKLEKIPQKQMD